jgi:hypothetical protein
VVQENTSGSEGRITFSLAGALAGARRCVPIAISGCGIGLVFGTLAGRAGALAVVIVSLRTGRLPAAMVTGVGTVLALRALEANLL